MHAYPVCLYARQLSGPAQEDRHQLLFRPKKAMHECQGRPCTYGCSLPPLMVAYNSKYAQGASTNHLPATEPTISSDVTSKLRRLFLFDCGKLENARLGTKLRAWSLARRGFCCFWEAVKFTMRLLLSK